MSIRMVFSLDIRIVIEILIVIVIDLCYDKKPEYVYSW